METQTNKLGITKGEWRINPVESAFHSIGILEPGPNGEYKGFTFYEIAPVKWNPVHTNEEREANAILIADAGTTANKCGLLPSELFEQRNELLEALKSVREWYEQNREKYLGQETPICFSKALSVIQKATTT